MPSVHDKCCQRCCAWWPPVTFTLMSETLTVTFLSSLCSPSLFLLMSLFSLSFLLSQEASVLTPKEKMAASLPVIFFRVAEAYVKCFSGWLCHREGIVRLCMTPAASLPMDMKCSQCCTLCGVKSAEGSWAVEMDEGFILSWGPEFTGKKPCVILVPSIFKKGTKSKVLLSLVEAPSNGMMLYKV